MEGFIRGRYEPLEVVGRGGQGEVIKAYDHQHRRIVALKSRAVGDADREGLLHEVRVLLSLRPYEGLPIVRDDLFEGDRYYVVMDWIEGTSLQKLLDERGNPGLPYADVCSFVQDAAEALDHLHEHIPPVVHGDVKPSNLLVAGDGRIVLVDFGISGGAGTGDKPAGSWGYVAPETAGGAPLSAAADVFGLAATAHTLLTGAPPKIGTRPKWTGLGRYVARVERAIRQGLALDPGNRPATAGKFARSLAPQPRRKPSASPTNLPAQLTSFVGRRSDVAAVKRQLTSSRLVTITGPGGIGKTRLSIEVASSMPARFAGGAWLVELAPLSDPTLVTGRVASVLSIGEEPGRELAETIAGHIRSRTLLLVLDNCEHVLKEASQLAETLLSRCPRLRILATSREPLGVAGEQQYQLQPLPVPGAGHPLDVNELSRVDSVALFVARASSVRSGFRLTRKDVAAVTQICRTLDGIPLAIELAAARSNLLSVHEIAGRLSDRLSFLSSGGALGRQRTLRAAVEWSYELLTVRQRRLFEDLSVFSGFSLAAAEAVVDSPEANPIDTLSELVNKSLVTVEDRETATRYRMLETIRDYGREKLSEAGRADAIAARHLAWCLTLARDAERELQGPAQAIWLTTLNVELDNVRVGLAYAESALGAHTETALEIVGALWRFWVQRGYFSEGRTWAEHLVGSGAGPQTSAKAKALKAAGIIAEQQGDYAASRRFHEDSLSIERTLGNTKGIAACLVNLGAVAQEQGDFVEARRFYDESLTLWRSIGDRAGIAISLNNLGNVSLHQGDYARARELFEESLVLEEVLGNDGGIAVSLDNLGEVARAEGDYEKALGMHARSLAIERALGVRHGIAASLNNLAAVTMKLGRFAEAHELLEESFALAEELGDRRETANSLNQRGDLAIGTADLAAAEKDVRRALEIHSEIADREGLVRSLEGMARILSLSDPQRGALLLGAASRLRESMGVPVPTSERAALDDAADAIRTAVGDERLEQLRAEGTNLSMEDAVSLATAVSSKVAAER